MNSRDDFTEKVKGTLRERVGSNCSNPGCLCQTTGPHSDPAKSLRVGVAAHITAAAPGGYRYDSSLTPDERKYVRNGIWLCQTCSVLIDRDVHKYSVELLQDWKREAENRADRLLSEPHGQPRELTPTITGQMYGVPWRQMSFVGRENELARLLETLNSKQQPASIAVSGLAGIGKTSLVTEGAYRLLGAPAFNGAVVWLDAGNPDLTAEWQSDRVGGALAPQASLEDRCRCAVQRIKAAGCPVVIVLDNVSAWSRDSRPGPLPDGPNVSVVMITRDAQVGRADCHQIIVEGLQHDESKRLLLDVAAREIEPGVQDLLEVLDGHALALELAGVYLSYEGTAEEYRERFPSWNEEREAAAAVRYQDTTLVALQAMWELLPEDGRAAWALASCFAPGSVGLSISDPVGLGKSERRVLQRYHILKLFGTAPDQRWSMHSLVREYGRERVSTQLAQKAEQRFFLGVSVFAASENTGRSYAPLLEADHLEAACKIDIPQQLLIPRSSIHTALFEIRSRLGLYREALNSARRALSDVEVSEPKGSDRVLCARVHVAMALRLLERLPEVRKLLEGVISQLNKAHALWPSAANTLAQAYANDGFLHKAREQFEIILKHKREVFGDSDPSTLLTQADLAFVLNTLGQSSKSQELLLPVLEHRRRTLGEEHQLTLSAASGLAETQRALGNLEKSRMSHERILEVRVRTLGKNHAETLASANNLAKVLVELGHLREALPLASETAADAAKLWGKDNDRVVALRQYIQWIRAELNSGQSRLVPASKSARSTTPAKPDRSTRVPRNAPCPCGSGRKWKRCCGKK